MPFDPESFTRTRNACSTMCVPSVIVPGVTASALVETEQLLPSIGFATATHSAPIG